MKDAARSATASGRADDWTTGHPAVVYQLCSRCAAIWYFRRSFCPRCGDREVENRRASGDGIAYAKTTVMRAPSPELQALAPYSILLVDAVEGFRLAAHGASNVSIGDPVMVQFRQFGGRLVPYFDKRT